MEEQILERIPIMQDYLEEKTNELLHQRLITIEKAFGENKAGIRDRLIEVLVEFTQIVHTHREYENISISYLQSSYITEKHMFLVSCHGKILFLEDEPPGRELDLSPLFKDMGEDIMELEIQMKKKFIRILTAEREEISRWYKELLYLRLRTVLENIMEKYSKEDGVPLFYGGYMDEQKQIGRI